MRGFSSLASRSSPALRNLANKPYNQIKFQRQIPLNIISRKALNQSSSTGKDSLVHPQLRNPSSRVSISARKQNLHFNNNNPIDHQYIAEVLSRKDWFLLLNHEFKAKGFVLSSQFVASVLHNQGNPSNSLKFYTWVSNIDPSLSKNRSILGVLGSTFYRKGPLVLSVELVQDIRKSGFQVSEELLCILIGSWGRLGLAKYCAEVFGQLSFLAFNPNTRLYNAVIDALVKSNSLDLAYLKFQQMSADNCSPDRFTYNILIHGVCKIGVVDEALRLVKQMESVGFPPNVFTYTMLIDGFCNSKRVEEAFQILETMKERNVSPNEATIRSFVHGVFRCLVPSKAFELLFRFVENGTFFSKLACDTILYCLNNNSMAREAAQFLREIGLKGYLPDSSTFNVAMVCLIKGLDLNDTCEVFKSFVDRGVKPGFNTYLALVEAMYKSGRCEKANDFLELMFKDELVSDVYSYNVVIDCFCKAKMMAKASEAFQRMMLRGIAPNLVTFNILITGYCKVGKLSRAREHLLMLFEFGFKPDIFTFTSLIGGLCRVHQIEGAFDCFFEMIEWGVTPNYVTYNILIRSLCVIGDTGRSLRLLKKMQADGIRLDTFSFNALILKFFRMGKIEKVENLFCSMLEMGVIPEIDVYTNFIHALCKAGKFDEAKEIFVSVEEHGCIPDSYTCNSILDSLVHQCQFDDARNVIKSFSQRAQFISGF
ncbi:putative pentatricopeptide repeat-containing protein At3g16890, mitochondrial [Humulus lupulus]|uniref:putative pentatricopeptide repeat-containing protein At3g16890, mitochondrial n=1 Tax=Humulus lupulus TaxID=3486 RepID=UPI002B4163B4|nr:putative pentatricopeptide repeat-containing protein At3g16890, mitochondrial [Humulus lupulus]XP_062077773.1 putative pentatricopeptide repeat-containing protein At3g16890, mitochondrial [Humulus lupulus]